MQRYSSRLLVAVSAVLSALLIALAVIQYRWAGRVAQADLERTRNHLQSSAALFAREFNLALVEAYVFFQSQAGDSETPPAPLAHMADLPRIAKDVYLLDLTKNAEPRLYHLQHDGAWAALQRDSAQFQTIAGSMMRRASDGTTSCDSRLLDEVPALIIPLAARMQLVVNGRNAGLRRCMYVGLDEEYLRGQLLPDLVQRNFGKDAGTLYSFTVRSRSNSRRIFYSSGGLPEGREIRPDVEQPLFAIRMEDLMAGRTAGTAQPGGPGLPGGARIVVRSFITRSAVGYLSTSAMNEDAGLWQLGVMPKSGPLASSLTRWREGNLLLSMAVELMLLAGLAFIIVAARRMQRLAEQKMQFVAGITHELRNPLSAICMLAGNQADGLVSSPEQVRQYGSLIRQQGGRLNEMVEQALQFAGVRAQARLVRRTELDLRRVIDDALEASRSELERAGFQVEKNIAKDLPPVRGNAEALQQAIENLLSNAVKYGNGNCWVRLSAQSDKDGKSVCITVEDRGIGIDPADAGQIFEPFYRGARAVDAQIPGTGLGLSLVRSTAALHRGSVSFESAPGGGSSFTLRLPAADHR